MVLFRNERFQFRAVYRLAKTDASINLSSPVKDVSNEPNEELPATSLQHFIKVSGKGPSKISEADVKNYYTLNTGKKTFHLVNGKTFGFNVAGMTIDDSFWKASKPKKMEVRK